MDILKTLEKIEITEIERKKNAEFSTPTELRREMLDLLPDVIWKTPSLRFFEPSSGKGLFIMDIYIRLNEGLKTIIIDDTLRHEHIKNNMIYYGDINQKNVDLLKSYGFVNGYSGDTLKMDSMKEWGLEGFDVIIGNPPYNHSCGINTGNIIYHHFTKMALKNWLKKEGYLLFIHPPNWRKANFKRCKLFGFFEMMTRENQMLVLKIYDKKAGYRYFNAGTRFDIFLIKKTPNFQKTIVYDEFKKRHEIQLSEFDWLSNFDFEMFQKVKAKAGEETCEIIFSRSAYASDNIKQTSFIKNEEFKYPCVHSICLKKTKLIYSNVNNKGFFNIPKIIFSESGIRRMLIDSEGEFGMSNYSMGIKIKNKEEGEMIMKAMLSEKFKRFMKSCSFSTFRVDYHIFKKLKKEFWKYFL